jgi:hypothetical protein
VCDALDGQVDKADWVIDYVDAFIARQRQDLLPPVRVSVVVDTMICSILSCDFALFIRACGADDTTSIGFGYLDCHDPQTAGCRMDENRLPGLDAGSGH